MTCSSTSTTSVRKAGLSVLDHMADTTQVILFTHHSQVATQAAAVMADDRLTVHEL